MLVNCCREHGLGGENDFQPSRGWVSSREKAALRLQVSISIRTRNLKPAEVRKCRMCQDRRIQELSLDNISSKVLEQIGWAEIGRVDVMRRSCDEARPGAHEIEILKVKWGGTRSGGMTNRKVRGKLLAHNKRELDCTHNIRRAP